MRNFMSFLLPRWLRTLIAHVRPRFHHPLDPLVLERAMAAKLPTGIHKDQVIEFVRRTPSIFCDDLGAAVETRLLGRALDDVHTMEIHITFYFDLEQRLLGYKMYPCLTFY
jgi:hypothetical protein